MMFKCSLVVFNRCVLRVGLVGLRRLHFARPGGHTRWLVQTVEGADFRRPQTRTFTWPRAPPCTLVGRIRTDSNFVSARVIVRFACSYRDCCRRGSKGLAAKPEGA